MSTNGGTAHEHARQCTAGGHAPADREGLALSRRQHELMIELLKGRDSWALAQLCVDHMQFSKSDYLGRIAEDQAKR